MPQDRIGQFLKVPAPKPRSASIDDFLKNPVIPEPTPAPPPPEAPGFLQNLGTNLKVGLQRAGQSLQEAERVATEAIESAFKGDFTPTQQILERTARGAAPFVSALGARPELAGQTFLSGTVAQAQPIAQIAQSQAARLATKPEYASREAAAERARLDVLAAQDPSLAGKIVRRGTEVVVSALPEVAAGIATGGSVPAMAGVAAFQSLAQPEMMIPAIALSATPIPIGKAIAPIVRRIRPGKVAQAAIPDTPPVAPEPAIPAPQPALPAIEAPPALAPIAQPVAPAVAPQRALTPAQLEAEALNSAIQKLGTDSADEIAEMIANANRRFNKTISEPGQPKRKITPAERQSMRDDYERVRLLTKEENNALAEVLPERTFSPVQAEGKTSRAISDIPIDEPSAQLDANLRQLKAFFGSQDIVQESRIAAAIGQSANDPGRIRVADLGLDHVEPPTPMHAPDAVPVGRRLSVDDIQLGRDELSKGRMFQVRESLKGGVKPEKSGVRLKEQVQPIIVTPDPARPGKFIVTDDGNHRIALLKLQGVTDDIPVKSFETPAQTASISSAVGPRAGEVSAMEVEIGQQLREAIGGMRARRAAKPEAPPPIERNMDPLDVGSMRGAEQVPLLNVAARKSPLRRTLNLLADLYQIPRSIMSSMDVSFPARQGFIFLAPPSRWGQSKKVLTEMFRAMIPDKPTSLKGGIKAQFAAKTERFQRMADVIRNDLDAQTGMEAGLKMTSQERGFRRADGEFMSDIAGRLPGVRESQQGYTMAADHTRLGAFKLYKSVLDKRAAKEGLSADQIKEGYKAAARWINIASGRGSFGEKADKAMDALSFFFFSPRFIASRIQVLNPATYLRNLSTPLGREVLKLQMSEMAQLTAMVGGTLFMAKQAGFKVGTNPEKPDFLRISKGNYHYDGLAGLQPVMRLVYGLGNDAARIARGDRAEAGRDALDIGARFLRSKLAPVPSFFTDAIIGRTVEGKPFDPTTAAVERVTPIMWGDFAEAYQREGIGGPLKLAPGAVGFGAQFFEPKPIDAAIEARPQLMNELVRLQIKLRDPRRKEGETDAAYKGRQQAIANLYTRYGATLMADRSYAILPDQEKQDVFDVLHSRILDAVNTRDRRTGQFQPSQLINSVRRSAKQKTIRERLISRRPAL